jgi:hypothetical protein
MLPPINARAGASGADTIGASASQWPPAAAPQPEQFCRGSPARDSGPWPVAPIVTANGAGDQGDQRIPPAPPELASRVYPAEESRRGGPPWFGAWAPPAVTSVRDRLGPLGQASGRRGRAKSKRRPRRLTTAAKAARTCQNPAMAWGLLAQSEAPEPLLPEGSSWDWLLSLGVAFVVVAVLVAVAIYVVRSRRLAAQAIAEVEQLRSSLRYSSGRPL